MYFLKCKAVNSSINNDLLRFLSFIVGALAASASAHAHGGLSSLQGLLILMLLLVGVGGLVVVAFMIPAVRSGIRNGALSKWGIVGFTCGALYVVTGLYFYLLAQEEEWSKFPGLVTVSAIALLLLFFMRHRKRLRTGVLAAIGIMTVALLVTPAQFWKGNTFDLVRTTYVDNSAGMLAPSVVDRANRKRQILHFENGGNILQFERSSETDAIGGLFTSIPGDLVLLEKLETARSGEWFNVSHYEIDPNHVRNEKSPWSEPRYSLFQRSEDMYRLQGRSSIGVRMNKSAQIDYRALLLDVLAWSETRPLKNELVLVGEIDVNEQSFIDEAFEKKLPEAYRFLVTQGIDVDATNSDGESLLHRAADVADVSLMESLVGRGADTTAKNAQGLEPLEYFVARHGHRSIAMRPFRLAFPEAAVD